MSIAFHTITDLSALEPLRTDWNRLVECSPVDHAFMRHEWFCAWLTHLRQPGQSMAFVTGTSDNRLVAAVPLIRYRDKLKGIPAEVLAFAASTITPRCNFIAANDFDPAPFWAYVLSRPGADLVVLRGVDRETDSTRRFIQFLQRSGLPVLIESARRSPYLLTGITFDEYLNSLTKKFRNNLKQAETKMSQAGTIRCQKIQSFKDLQQILPDLVEVSARSWKAEHHTDLKSLPHVVAFLDSFSRLGEHDHLWEAWVLFLNEQPIAFDYYLCGPQRMSLIRTDFDLAFKHLSPGHNLQLAVFRDLFSRKGIWEYDMGGQAYEYKLRWTDKIREHIDIWTAGAGWRGRLLMFGKQRLLPLLARSSPPPPPAESEP